jgi:chemotaxis protein MotA
VNFKVLFSFILAILTIVYTIIAKGGDNPSALVDYNALIIVIGGTVACGAVAYNIDRIMILFKVFLTRMLLGKGAVNYRNTIRELMMIAHAYRSGVAAAQKLVGESKDEFLKEAMEMMLEGHLPESDLRNILNKRVKTLSDRYGGDAKMLMSLGKYPPAMGLMGAVVGMVALLGVLGKPGAESKIGPAMSVALLATFYGIAFANLFVIPVGEHLYSAADEIKIKNSMIVEGVFLVAAKTNPIVLGEQLNSFLLPAERLNVKEVAAGKG